MPDKERVPTLTKEKKRKQSTSRLLWIMGWTLLVCISAVIFFKSPLSKIDEIIVKNITMLDSSEVVQLTNIEKGQSFFTVNTFSSKKKITSLPEVKKVEVTRSFPGKVIIHVSEYEHVAFDWDDNNELIPILENGTRLENRVWSDRVVDRPIIRDWNDMDYTSKLSEELNKLDKSILNEISEIEPDPIENEMQRLILYMKDGYQVQTSIRHFAKNMAWYPSFVANLKQEDSPKGTIMLLDGKWFVPYEEFGPEEGARE